MVLEVWDDNVVSDALIGAVEIDLEDRWMAMQHRRLKALTSRDFLEKYTSLREPIEVDLRDQEGILISGDKERFKPRLAPFPAAPMEVRALSRKDEQTDEFVEAGTLRFWCDMIPAGSRYEDFTFEHAEMELELRMVIWGVEEVGRQS